VKGNKITVDTDELLALIEADDASLSAYFSSIPHAADLVEFFDLADIKYWPRFLLLIGDEEKRAELILHLDRARWPELLEHLDELNIATLLKHLESDDAADLLAALVPEKQLAVLRALPLEDRNQLAQLLKYPEDSAGGIMQVERAQVRFGAVVADAITKVRELVEEDVEVLAVWVVDDAGRLMGTVALSDLLLNKSTSAISTLVNTEIISVKPLVDQEEVARIFKKYDLLALPVVDDDNVLLGRIVIDDVIDVLSEEAEEDTLQLAGTSPEELFHETDALGTARIRFPWLVAGLICSFVSMLVLVLFQPLIERAVALFTFIPVISNMSGGVATQSATVIIHGFSTGKADLSDLPRILFKEMRVGMLMGLAFGLLAGGASTLILGSAYYHVGVVVFVSMCVALTAATLLGVFAPAILKRLGADPAVASGPFVTSLMDITGILLYMITATLFLRFFGTI
jgi:magnesium transporter